MHLPKVELDKFDGNPLAYLTFIAVFAEVVDNNVMAGHIKLTRLLQYTCGSAKAAIRNCALIGGESGYNQARANLHNSLTHSSGVLLGLPTLLHFFLSLGMVIASL